VMGGMTAGQQVGEEIIYVNYKGAPVFDEFDEQGRIKSVGNSEHSGVNEETVRQLVADTHQAKTTLNNARKSAGGRQAPRQ
jgi:hypothetical protein